MTKDKFTLVIDGNYFFFRTLYVLPGMSSQKLKTEKEVGIYVRKLATDFASEIRKFYPIVDKIVMTIDSKSWRKDFYPESDYKGNRKADDSINWDNFKKATDAFRNSLEQHGVIIQKVDGAEGDDLIYGWSTASNIEGKSVIIFTGDKDLIQLVSSNESTDALTLFYSGTHKRLCVPEGFWQWIEDKKEIDLFDMSSVSSNKIKVDLYNLIQDNKLVVDEIDSGTFLFKKVLMGDAGDNVKPIYWYSSKGNSGKARTYGVSEKKADKVIENFVSKHGRFEKSYLFNETYQREICNIVVKELAANKMPYETILQNLKNNANLVSLTSDAIPESIHNVMLEEISHTIESRTDFTNLKNMDNLLKDTAYSKNTVSTHSIFSDDSEDEDFSFIKKDKKTGSSKTF
jgi:5'-3' exonuclease